MNRYIFLLAGGVLLLSGCAGVKSTFDCDATTSDTCMTMTKANQLARDKAAKNTGKQAAGGLPSLVNLPTTSAAVHPSASRSASSNSSGVQVTSDRPTVSGSIAAGTNTTAATSTLTPRPAVSGGNPAPSCQSVRCDNPGTVHPQRSRDRIATVWIAPWVDSDNAFHQPGRVSFVVTSAEWLLPSRIN
ncbi:TPA: type IV conjugative transfer system lipoprotein TraV [Escherichia coli]|nr:type IV conjugative transfer system lipoprotein TraV [Escherichia coli]